MRKIEDEFSHIPQSDKRWRLRHPERARQSAKKTDWLWRYGLTKDQYDVMLAAQNNRCAICETTDFGRKNANHFSVDHDHATGRIRGLLCNQCNRALGFFKDSKDLLLKAVQYLEK